MVASELTVRPHLERFPAGDHLAKCDVKPANKTALLSSYGRQCSSAAAPRQTHDS
jgi:hypothetical protein